MKKLFFLMFMAVGLMSSAAKATPTTTVVYDYGYGANNYDTFTYYVSADGYLHYSLIDNGPGGTYDPVYNRYNYESTFGVSYVDPVTHENVDFFVNNNNGGNIVGSIYIGTTNTTFDIEHGCGFFYDSDNIYEGEEWTVDVSF